MIRAVAAIAAVAFSLAVHAGQACTEQRLAPAEVRAALTLALDVTRTLDDAHANVAIVARVGRDLSRYGLRYSHVAFAWREHPRGGWTMVEELNRCGSAESALFDDGVGDFFLDDMFAYEAAIVVPSAGVQRRIGALLAARRGGDFHEAHYNLVAYAWSTRYQNSNQWVLETIAGALDDRAPRLRRDAQTWLRAHAFTPGTIHVTALERFGAALTQSNVTFDDHPPDRRMAGRIDVVTAESVLAFVRRIDPGAVEMVVTLPPALADEARRTHDARRAPGQDPNGRTR